MSIDTTEPIGQVFYAADGGDDETGAGYYMKACVHWFGKAPAADTKLYTHPTPTVPVTGEPVQADSSEHLRVIASLGAALRRLSFAAQTTGGTAGPDAELQSAIGQAEQALSLGGIWQAMSATPEPVLVQHRKPVAGWKGETVGYTAWRDGKGLDWWPHRELYDHPTPGVPDGWKLVPIEPTEEMLLAYTGGAITDAGFRWCRHQWSAMLAASPAQKGGE